MRCGHPSRLELFVDAVDMRDDGVRDEIGTSENPLMNRGMANGDSSAI